MSNYAAVIKAAKEILEAQSEALDRCNDADLLTDAQLAELAGPGCAEVDRWEGNAVLPETVPGLTLLADLLEARAHAYARLMAVRRERQIAALSEEELEAIARRGMTEAARAASEGRSLTDDELLEVIARGGAAR